MLRELCDSEQLIVSEEQEAIEFNRLTGSSRSEDESRGPVDCVSRELCESV